MLVSEFIKQLKDVIKKYGDLDIAVLNDDVDYGYEVFDIELYGEKIKKEDWRRYFPLSKIEKDNVVEVLVFHGHRRSY